MTQLGYQDPTDSEVDHYRMQEFHQAQNSYGENMHRLSTESRDEALKSLGPDFNMHKHLRPLSVDEKRYMKHIYFNHYRPAQQEMEHAKSTNNPQRYQEARIARRAALVEVKHHFGQVWSNAMHMSSFENRTPKQENAVNALHTLGMSEVPDNVRQARREGNSPAPYRTELPQHIKDHHAAADERRMRRGGESKLQNGTLRSKWIPKDDRPDYMKYRDDDEKEGYGHHLNDYED